MNLTMTRGIAAIAMLLLVHAASAKERKTPTYTYARIVQSPNNYDACHSKTAASFDPDREWTIGFKIVKDGTPTETSAPERSPEWVSELARCALERQKFSTATRDGEPIDQSAQLTMRFRAADPDSGEIMIDEIGSLVTPPIMHFRRSVDGCIPQEMMSNMSRFVATFTVLPDGSTTRLVMPVGSEPQHEKIALCMLQRMAFTPGSRDGVAVESEAKMPIFLMGYSETADTPALRSSGAQLEAAYRACYPPDSVTMTSAFYRFDVAKDGRLENHRVVKSTGDRHLDEAGICILRMLEFTPMKQDGSPIRSNVTWELPLRPAR